MTRPHVAWSRWGSLACALAALPAEGATVIEKIVLEGDAVPALGAGVTINAVVLGTADLNDEGEVSYRVRVTGGGVLAQDDTLLYRDATIAVREGDPIPALPGTTYLISVNAQEGNDLNDAGRIAFFTTPQPGGTQNDALLVDGTVLVAREGDTAPGTALAIGQVAHDPEINDADQVLWSSLLTGATTATDTALFRDQTLLAREGDAAPGAGGALFGDLRPGSNLPGLERAAMNEAGQVAFYTLLTGTGVTSTNNEAIYRDGALVARTGDPEPGPGGLTVTNLSQLPEINASGQVAYSVGLAGGATAIYRDATLIARSGDVAPGTGGATFALVGTVGALGNLRFAAHELNDAGDVAFAATLTVGTAGVTAANDVVLYRGSSLVAREGDPAPGLPAGVTLANFFVAGSPTTANLGIDAAGRVAYRAALAGTGVNSLNNEALFFWNGTTSELIAREGDSLPGAGPIDGATPLVIQRMNAAGQVLFSALVDDATITETGYFLASPDDDGDGVADVDDNCPFEPNPSQSDVGGVGAASTPDGIGDACQCGDVNGNGRVTTADATLMTRSLLLPPTATLARPDLCNVGGSAGCTTADAVIATRALLVPPTATVQQVCPAALP